jgi:arginyl-tRNA synthetase
MTLYTRFAAHIDAALDTLTAAGTLPAGLDRKNVTVEPPRDTSHGDLATNAAMVLAKPAKTWPTHWSPNCRSSRTSPRPASPARASST